MLIPAKVEQTAKVTAIELEGVGVMASRLPVEFAGYSVAMYSIEMLYAVLHGEANIKLALFSLFLRNIGHAGIGADTVT